MPPNVAHQWPAEPVRFMRGLAAGALHTASKWFHRRVSLTQLPVAFWLMFLKKCRTYSSFLINSPWYLSSCSSSRSSEQSVPQAAPTYRETIR